MKCILFIILIAFAVQTINADDLKMFQMYSQRADSAFGVGNKELCFNVQHDLIALFNTNRKKYIKNKDICAIMYQTYGSLAILDNRMDQKSICQLLSEATSLIHDNPAWVNEYTNKNSIIDTYINLISGFTALGNISQACKYNEGMISFAEQYCRFDIASVLMTACAMYSGMEEFDKNYPLYQRLYEMFDDLDRHQQYKVVTELIHFEYKNKNFVKMIEMSKKHEKLIRHSKEENRDVVLDIIGFGYDHNANSMANREMKFSDNVKQAYETGCEWALRNLPILYPIIKIDYAYWLYSVLDKKDAAIRQFELYLDAIEKTQDSPIFDESYRLIRDAEQALISIFICQIIKTDTPRNIYEILNKYPKIIAAIENATQSKYYTDYKEVLEVANKISHENFHN